MFTAVFLCILPLFLSIFIICRKNTPLLLLPLHKSAPDYVFSPVQRLFFGKIMEYIKKNLFKYKLSHAHSLLCQEIAQYLQLNSAPGKYISTILCLMRIPKWDCIPPLETPCSFGSCIQRELLCGVPPHELRVNNIVLQN